MEIVLKRIAKSIWLQRLINAMTAARDRGESIWITIL